ncbi:hypothetical protein KYK29_15715 [Shinella daejeonensis]|uniref:hypothetical protein n=1 Tax=Shinella daejeonensis TaxID=659017 RepID=UPI0020C75852|nr:hypothetical protein [Shinella daejeonensis]MCP8896375.1 hypothetical protein [Shinella daejeonensis]
MPVVQITEDQVALSHDVVSLLSVCTYVAERMAEDDDKDMVDDLARCLVCAHSWAKQVHEDLSGQYRINQRARA